MNTGERLVPPFPACTLMSLAARADIPVSVGAYFCLLACREIPRRGDTHHRALRGNFLAIAKEVLVQKPSSSTPSIPEAKIAGNVFHDFWEHTEMWLKGQGRVGLGGKETNQGLGNAACCAERQVTMHLMNKTSCATYRKDESGPPVSVEGYLQSLDPVVQHWRIDLRGRCWVSSRLWREGTHAFRKQHEIAHTNNTKTHSLRAYAAD